MAEPKKGWWEAQSRPLNPRQDYYLPGNEPTDVTFMFCHFKAGTRVSWPRGAGR